MAGKRERLTRQRHAMGMTQEQLAAVLGVERSTIYRWESGEVAPRPDLQPRLARALGLTPAELANLLMPHGHSSHVSATRHDSGVDGPALTQHLLPQEAWPGGERSSPGLDAPQPAELTSVGRTSGAPSWPASKLPSPVLDGVLDLARPSRISTATVDALESTIADFWRRDDQYGGEALRPVVTAQLRNVAGLLQECRKEEHRRRLQAIAAELARLSGWMLFDARQFHAARTYFEEALRLAGDIDDYPSVGNVLASMSLQATYEGAPNDALALARAAQDACRARDDMPRVNAMLAMREAFAHATLGDSSACHATITRAQQSLDRAHNYERDPEWVSYFGEAKLTVDAGIALSQLGATHDAKPLIEQGLRQQDPANTRPRALHAFWLATTQLNAGNLDEACATGHHALELASSVASTRVIGHLDEFSTRLAACQQQPAARDLRERISDFVRNALP